MVSTNPKIVGKSNPTGTKPPKDGGTNQNGMKHTCRIDYDYGISGALRFALTQYGWNSAQTGRTEAMLYSARLGDRVVVENKEKRRWMEEKIQQLGIKGIEVINCPANRRRAEITLGTFGGVTHFDHTWIEAYIDKELCEAFAVVEHLTKRALHPNRLLYCPFNRPSVKRPNEGGENA